MEHKFGLVVVIFARDHQKSILFMKFELYKLEKETNSLGGHGVETIPSIVENTEPGMESFSFKSFADFLRSTRFLKSVWPVLSVIDCGRSDNSCKSMDMCLPCICKNKIQTLAIVFFLLEHANIHLLAQKKAEKFCFCCCCIVGRHLLDCGTVHWYRREFRCLQIWSGLPAFTAAR